MQPCSHPRYGLIDWSKGTSGESFFAMMVRVLSRVTVVCTGGPERSSPSSPGTCAQPSSTARRLSASNRPAGLLMAPRPLRACSGRTSTIPPLWAHDENISRTSKAGAYQIDPAKKSGAPARALRNLVQGLDGDRERDRAIDISLGHVEAGAIGDQDRADHEQKAEREHLHRRLAVEEPGQRPGCDQHDDHRDDDRRRHHPKLVRHADRRDHAVEGKDDVE